MWFGKVKMRTEQMMCNSQTLNGVIIVLAVRGALAMISVPAIGGDARDYDWSMGLALQSALLQTAAP